MALAGRVASQVGRCGCLLVNTPYKAGQSSSWTAHSLRYATSLKKGAAAPKKKGASFAKKKGSSAGETGSDSRSETLRKTLYGSDASARRSQDLARAEALTKAIPSLEAHETIMRAWQLRERTLREQREEDMQKRYDCMIAALDMLEQTDIRLFNLATKGPKFSNIRPPAGTDAKQASLDGRIEGLFPRQLPVLL